MSSNEYYYELADSSFYLKNIKKERKKARLLKKTQWWLDKVNQGICYYCNCPHTALTMDHIVPLARGGLSNRGNIVAACQDCNKNKQLDTPVDKLFRQLGKLD